MPVERANQETAIGLYKQANQQILDILQSLTQAMQQNWKVSTNGPCTSAIPQGPKLFATPQTLENRKPTRKI